MKKVTFSIFGLFLIGLIWMGFVREPLTPIPVIETKISEEVKLDFSINSMNTSGLEFALNGALKNQGMYLQFKMNNAWKTGRSGLVLTNMNSKSSFKNGMTPAIYKEQQQQKNSSDPDFRHFMKDKNGKSVNTYSFKQQLVVGKDAKKYLLIAYDGPEMAMIQTLKIPKALTLPDYISSQFVTEGSIQFQPGTFTFDKETNGFYIPIILNNDE